MKFRKILAGALVAAMAAAAPASAAVLSIGANGKLIGASGVIVGGKSYDVAFLGGTCAEVYGTCKTSAFTFTTTATAKAAGQALLDQVFIAADIDGQRYDFDATPSLTNGCSGEYECQVSIPTETYGNNDAYVGGVIASNRRNGEADDVNTGFGWDAATTLGVYQTNYARFVPTATAVPEPTTWALMLAGFGMVGGVMRRRQRIGTRSALV